jgi:hypothetical protein
MADRSEPMIFPIGHYVGAHVPSPGAGADFHVVRIGWEMYRLEGDEQFAVWAMAHGVPDAAAPAARPAAWTRATLEGAARATGIPDVASTITDLLGRDLIVEVTPGSPEAVEFAQVCRTRSLLVGLGNSPGDPLLYAIGATQNSTAIRVPPFAYELWKWGHGCDSLWHACQVIAAAAEPGDADPEQVLGRCLAAIQQLLATGAIYLDEAREEQPAFQPAG